MRSSTRRHLAKWPHLGMLMALILACLAGIATLQPLPARAAGSDPIIHWDSHMIYPGQNNGYPWGPVGELATVHGDKFTGAAVLGQPVKLALIQGDVNNPPGGDSSYEFCKLAGPKIAVGQTNVDGAGTFDFNFTWPAAAGSGMYSICAYNTVDGLPVGNIDDGPFSVLSSAKPSVAVSRTSVAQGETITVTGKNWTPPQDVNVYIAACVDCDGPIVIAGTAHSSGLHSGTFSMKFSIPGSATPGAYVAGANAHGGVLDVGPGGAKHVTITAAPTATAESSPTAAQATVVAGNGAGNGNADNGSALGGVSLPVLIIAGVGLLLLLVLIILLVVILSRRGGNKPPASATGSAAPGWGGSGSPANGYPDYGAGAAPAGHGTVQQNWSTLPPGWGDQPPPTASPDMPQGGDAPTRANFSHIPNSAYPPAPPPAYPAPRGDTPTRPGLYNNEPPKPYKPYGN